MAAPQFDLFAGAKGFEYARDQNEQDQNNELKKRQNDLMLGAFERQLREFEQGAELRAMTRENSTSQARMQGVTLKGQSAYQQSMMAARASLTPEERADTTVEGGLNKMLRMQSHLARSGATPETIEAFGKELGNAKASALRYAQYDPEMLNRILAGGAFGGEYRVNPVGKDGMYQVLRRVNQAGVSEDGYPLPPTYQPMAGSEGNLPTVATSMASMHTNSAGPDLGTNMFDKYQKEDFRRGQLAAEATRRETEQLRLGRQYLMGDATKNNIATGKNATTTANAEAKNQLAAYATLLRGKSTQRAALAAHISKNAATQDANTTAAQQAQLAAMDADIAQFSAQYKQLADQVGAAEAAFVAPVASVAPAIAAMPKMAPLAVPASVSAAAIAAAAAAQQQANFLQDQEQDANDLPDPVNAYQEDAAALEARYANDARYMFGSGHGYF